jgi:predicted MFS family arabinose efflux permease
MPGSAMPAAIRLFLAGNAVAMTGNGLVIAFTLIYLHQARGIALPIVGAPLAAAAAAGLLAVTVSGVLLDRLGGRRVLTGIILGQAVAQVLLAWAHNAATALPALLVYGATWAPDWRSGSCAHAKRPRRNVCISFENVMLSQVGGVSA